MLALGLLLNFAGIGLFCWLIFTLAAYALPFFVLCGGPHKTKNGKAYTARVKISQQNKPMPAKFRRSPRASMVVAP